MRVFAIGDLHLPSDRAKDMHRFGWAEHPAPLARAWDESVGPEDLVLLVGDLSWATRSHEAAQDFAWIQARPGKKVLIKGNHDHWWGDSYNKLLDFLAPYPSVIGALHAQGKSLTKPVQVGRLVIAGTRGWTAPEAPSMPADGEMGAETYRADLVDREADRLRGSLAEADKLVAKTPGAVKLAAMHFPPLYVNARETAFSRQIEAWKPEHCVYGHLHSTGRAAGFKGEHGGVNYHLVSCDEAAFKPVLITEV